MAEIAPVAAPTIRTFQVFPDIPEALKPLAELARNLWWVWNPDAVELFRRLDRKLWSDVYHNPVKLLGVVPQTRLEEAAKDDGYRAHVARVYSAFREHMDQKGWFQSTHPDEKMLVAYFSAEFGLHESLPIYSGGLGILAGDHLKSAAEIGVPLVGVGLLYRNGYFQQYLSADGWQQESYPELDFYNLPAEPCSYTDGSPVHVRIDMPDNAVFCKVWRVNVGRIPLYLLDTNIVENAPADRDITSRLYGTGTDLRIKQEIVLGIGGVRALEAMNIPATVFHMNEGHAAFLALERTRMLLTKSTLTFDEARQQVMATNVFTTHTPVPAGIDLFSPEVMLKFFKNFIPELKLNDEGFLALGREDVTNHKQGFSMAVLAIRLADSANGVSGLHGDVSRHMWHNIWPAVPPDEVPIHHITNGIHTRSWLAPDIRFVLERYLSTRWKADPTDQSVWQDVAQIPEEELWRAHERCRERLVSWVRKTHRQQLARRGAGYDDLVTAEQVLDPEALTIGFARRFATYKRGALLLRDPDRLKRLLENTKRPIQFVFAGKAHPADNEGKELIRTIVNFARQGPLLRRRMVFIENYDINVARYLVQGVDVWLNTPRRGMEASGTSGMKAAANGVPNCSILDGWWVEGYAPDLGWAIGRGEEYTDHELENNLESNALYDLLEKRIIPEFYDRDVDNLPHEWIARMKHCIAKLAPVFNTNRMVNEYSEKFYIPSARRGHLLAENGGERAVALAHAKERLHQRWAGVKIVGVHSSGDGHFKVGESMVVEALVDLHEIDPKEISVQLYSGPISATGQIEKPTVIPMTLMRQMAPSRHVFSGTVECKTSGRHGFAVRVLPNEPDMVHPFEPGLIAWD
jgi:starch phosphorylase